jgi:hypothetical protein
MVAAAAPQEQLVLPTQTHLHVATKRVHSIACEALVMHQSSNDTKHKRGTKELMVNGAHIKKQLSTQSAFSSFQHSQREPHSKNAAFSTVGRSTHEPVPAIHIVAACRLPVANALLTTQLSK